MQGCRQEVVSCSCPRALFNLEKDVCNETTGGEVFSSSKAGSCSKQSISTQQTEDHEGKSHAKETRQVDFSMSRIKDKSNSVQQGASEVMVKLVLAHLVRYVLSLLDHAWLAVQ